MPTVLEEREQTEQQSPDERRPEKSKPEKSKVEKRELLETAQDKKGAPAISGTNIKKPFYKRPLPLAVMGFLLLIGLGYGLNYYFYAAAHESTDDAFVDGNIIQISPKAVGHVTKIYVSDNQPVKKGDLI